MASPQIQQAIEEAQERVAQFGYKSQQVDTRDVLFAGLGYLAQKIEGQKAALRLSGRWTFLLGTMLGGLLGGFTQSFL